MGRGIGVGDLEVVEAGTGGSNGTTNVTSPVPGN